MPLLLSFYVVLSMFVQQDGTLPLFWNFQLELWYVLEEIQQLTRSEIPYCIIANRFIKKEVCLYLLPCRAFSVLSSDVSCIYLLYSAYFTEMPGLLIKARQDFFN